MKRFLYLFQVEQDLPPSLEVVAGPDSDIVFLSWRAKSADPRSIYYPSSSWTQGRNRLFKEVCDRDYLYFIFADDDLRLELTQSGLRNTGLPPNPWRVFEEFLLSWEPAIGCVSYDWHLTGGAWDLAQECQTLRFLDALLNAFHREAFFTLLPYYDLFDEESECYSQNILCSLAADLYAGHIMQTNRLRVTNTQTRREYGTFLLSRPENFYLAALRDGAAARRFLRQPVAGSARHPTMGPPLRKRDSYIISDRELAGRYVLGHALWIRKRELLVLSADDSFFSADPDSARARRWREQRPHRAVPPAASPRAVSIWAQTRSLAQKLTPISIARQLVLRWPQLRSHPVARFARALLDLRSFRLTGAPFRDMRSRLRCRDQWRSWWQTPGRFYEIPERRQGEVCRLLAEAMNELPTDRIVFIDVGAGVGDLLNVLQFGSGLRKSVFSIGIDPINTRGHRSYTGYVKGAIANGSEGAAEFYRYSLSDCGSLRRRNLDVFTHTKAEGGLQKYFTATEAERLEEVVEVQTFKLSTLIRQYGLANEVIHFLKIDAKGSDLDAFRSLEEFTESCLFLQIETVMPDGSELGVTKYEGHTTFREDREVIEAAGFRLFNIARFGVAPEADIFYVNRKLFRKLFPQWAD